MEKIPGYDCPHGHILYGKCAICAQEEEGRVAAPDNRMMEIARQRDVLLAALIQSRGMLSNAAMRIRWSNPLIAQKIRQDLDVLDKIIAKAKGGAA